MNNVACICLKPHESIQLHVFFGVYLFIFFKVAEIKSD